MGENKNYNTFVSFSWIGFRFMARNVSLFLFRVRNKNHSPVNGMKHVKFSPSSRLVSFIHLKEKNVNTTDAFRCQINYARLLFQEWLAATAVLVRASVGVRIMRMIYGLYFRLKLN